MLFHTKEGGKGRESSMGDQDLDDLLKALEREKEGGLHVNRGKEKSEMIRKMKKKKRNGRKKRGNR